MENITITKQEYNELKRNSIQLCALIIVGVEKWDFYDVAMLMVKRWEKTNNENNSN
jgi:hypothetical protein